MILKMVIVPLLCCLCMLSTYSFAADSVVVIPLNSSSKPTPVAYGNVSSDCTINSGSGNFTCEWNASLHVYQFTIDGGSFVFGDHNHITLVTPFSSVIAETGSVSGKLTVGFRNLFPGPNVQASFSFISYKP